MMQSRIILASRSPWRKRLLKKHGISCHIHASSFKELKHHRDPKFLVLYNAAGKAAEVAQHYKNAIIIGVDTIGVLGKWIIGKPRNRSEAKKMLMRLSSKMHRVISGLCVIDTKSGRKYSATVTTKVIFKKISPDSLNRYLQTNQWRGKAGAYAIQGAAKKFVSRIEGDLTNVIGIPIGCLKKILGHK